MLRFILAATMASSAGFAAAKPLKVIAESTSCDQQAWNHKLGVYEALYQPALKLQTDLLLDARNDFSREAKIRNNVIQIVAAADLVGGIVGAETGRELTAKAVSTSGTIVSQGDNKAGNIVASELLDASSVMVKPTPENVASHITTKTAEIANAMYANAGMRALADDYRALRATANVLQAYYEECGDLMAVRERINVREPFRGQSVNLLTWLVAQAIPKGDLDSAEMQRADEAVSKAITGVNQTYRHLRQQQKDALPDLRVNYLRTDPDDVTAGQSVAIDLDVYNAGDAPASRSTAAVRVIRPGQSVTKETPVVTTLAIPALSSAEHARVSDILTAADAVGYYEVWVTLDRANDTEQSPDGRNNDQEHAPFEVHNYAPDLEGHYLEAEPSYPTPGEKVTLRFRVHNSGYGRANASKARVRLATSDQRVTGDDPLVATFSLPAIPARKKHKVVRTVTLPETTPGDYTLWLIVDVDATAGQTFADEHNDKTSEFLSIETE